MKVAEDIAVESQKSILANHENEVCAQDITEEVVIRGEVSLDDTDLYIYSYWDNLKSSNAEEAIDYIEGHLKQNFNDFNVIRSDQIYQIFAPTIMEDNEIEIKVNLKKNALPVEHSAWKVQSGTLDDVVSVTLKTIVR